MPRTRLATFVHVSDLHIGVLDPHTGNAMLDPHAEAWTQRFHWFDGYLGHSAIALRHLDRFFHAKRKTEQADILVTGDLTTVGSTTEFSIAKTYLTSRSRLSNGTRLGLDMSDALERAVPGNHDHWPGKHAAHSFDPVMLGPSALQSVFVAPQANPTPRVTYRLVAPDVELALIRVNSDAGVTSRFGRLFGRGAFEQQLQDPNCAPRPPAPGIRQVRVMLLHHSPSCSAIKLGVTRRTQRALDQFLTKTDTRVLLTGHLHMPGGASHVTQLGSSRLEARCGSTTQRDFFPSHWQPRKRTLEKNILLMHRLFEEPNGSLIWEVERYERTTLGFVISPYQQVAGTLGRPAQQLYP